MQLEEARKNVLRDPSQKKLIDELEKEIEQHSCEEGFYNISLESMENPEWLVSTEYDPEEYTMQKRRHHVLRDSIAKLRPIEQKVIEMHYYQEMGIREIGRRIGYSHSWIEKTHRAAMEQLKNMKIQEFIEK